LENTFQIFFSREKNSKNAFKNIYSKAKIEKMPNIKIKSVNVV
jgi:hypothetical protein